MPRIDPVGTSIRFGDVELDARAGELRVRGVRNPLPGQPLQLLLALLERPGELVTRDELRQRLWPDNTFVDVEHGLNAAVKRLRDALGDSADVPRYIETLPRRGYRLIAAVTPTPAPPSAAPAPPEPNPLDVPGSELPAPESPPAALVPPSAAADRPEPRPLHANRPAASRSRAARIVAGLVAGLATVAVAGWLVDRSAVPQPAASSTGPTLTRVTDAGGVQTDVSWAPDGRRIVYASDQNGGFDLFVQEVTDGEPRAVATSPAADRQPAWSPAGDEIVFRSERDGGGLFLVGAEAGSVVRRLTTFGFHPQWMPGGREVLFATSEWAGTLSGMYLIVADGAARPRRVLTGFLDGGLWYWVGPTPDGRLLAVGHHRTHGFGFFTVAVGGGEPDIENPPATLLPSLGLDEPHPTVRCHWNQNGTALYLDVTPKDVGAIWRVPVRGSRLQWEAAQPLTIGWGSAAGASVSPDGSRLAFTSDQRRRLPWVFPFDATVGKVTGEGRAVTDADINVSDLALVHPDGRSVIYTAWRSGRPEEIWRSDLQTGGTEVVAKGRRGAALAADGRTIAYTLMPPRKPGGASPRASDIEFALAIRDPSGMERLLSPWRRDYVFSSAVWTGDGRHLLGSSWRSYPSGQVDLALWPTTQPAEAPVRVVLTAPDCYFWQPRFSPDERWISFVVARTGRSDRLEMGLVRAEAATSATWTRLAADHEWPDKPRWAPDGRTLYFLSRKNSSYFNLWGLRMDPERGEPVGEPFQITHLDTPDFAISPDIINSEMDVGPGRLVLTIKAGAGNIWMLSGIR